jgi:putative sigma-54 modulation protein
MSIIISVRSGKISSNVKSYAEKKAQLITDEYAKITSVRVIFDTQKTNSKAEVIIRGKSINIEADCEAANMYEALDAAIEKVAKQLRRHLDKIQDHKKPVKLAKKKDLEADLPPPPVGCAEYADM